MELRAETERSGFKQGEDINLNLLVTNETSRDVMCTEVSLVQRTVFVDIEGTFKEIRFDFDRLYLSLTLTVSDSDSVFGLCFGFGVLK